MSVEQNDPVDLFGGEQDPEKRTEIIHRNLGVLANRMDEIIPYIPPRWRHFRRRLVQSVVAVTPITDSHIPFDYEAVWVVREYTPGRDPASHGNLYLCTDRTAISHTGGLFTSTARPDIRDSGVMATLRHNERLDLHLPQGSPQETYAARINQVGSMLTTLVDAGNRKVAEEADHLGERAIVRALERR